MARLNSSKIVGSDSDDELPEMSTIFSAKSIATPRKSLIPRASSLAPDLGPNTPTRKPKRRVLGKATDNSLLRPLGKDRPAPEFEGRRKRPQVLGKTLFDDEDERPRARRAASRPAVALRRKIQDIAEEESEEEDSDEVDSTYVRPRTVRRSPRTVEASAKEQAVKPGKRLTRDVLEDFGNLTIQVSSESEEEVIKPRPTRTRAARKPSPPKYVESGSSEEEDAEEPEQQETHTQSECDNEAVVDLPQVDRTRSIPMVVLRAYEKPATEKHYTEDEQGGRSASKSEDEPVVKPQPTRRAREARNLPPLPDIDPQTSANGKEVDEMDVMKALGFEDVVEIEPVPTTIPVTLPQARLPSNIFNALQHLPPPLPRAPSPGASTHRVEESEDDSQEHLNTLEASCLEDDDEGEVEEGTAEVLEVYEHQESEEEDEAEDDDSDDMSDFIASDGEEENSIVSDSEVGFSEDDSPVKPAPRSVRRLVQGRKNVSPPPAPRDPVRSFQWSDEDREEEKRPVPTGVSRKLFGTVTTHKGRGLPTLSDSDDEDAAPMLDPHTPSDSENEMPPKERTPRSNKKQAEPSKRLKSPTKPKFPRLPVVSPPRRQSNDAFWEPEVINMWHDEYSPQKKLFQSPTKSTKPVSRPRLGGEEVANVDFNKSPTKASIARAKKAEKDAMKQFEATKNSIALAFLEELDQKVTGGQIAKMSESTGGVKIIWSAKLNTTAGRAHWRREGSCRRPTPAEPNPMPIYNHHCSIELASKVITEEHRLINVLAHEFCHLTTFMISKELKNPHGSEFKSWGRKVEKAFAGRDVVVTTKHSYEIAWKYVWQCQSCRRDVGRHSKSVDPKRMRCGICKGELVQIKPVPRGGVAAKPSTLFPDAKPQDGDSAFFDGTLRESNVNTGKKEPAKPKQLTDYQAFVKENMARIKADNPGSPMKDVMGLVGAKYREQKAGRKLFGEGGRLKEMKLSAAETEVDKMIKSVEVLDLTSP